MRSAPGGRMGHELRPYSLTLPKASAYIGLSQPELRRRIARGELRAARVGRRILVRIADLERFVDGFLEPADPLEDLDLGRSGEGGAR